MQLFKNILEEAIKRTRRNMPQIDNFEGLIRDVTIKGHKIIAKSVDADSLEPTQHDFNDEKIKSILDNKSYNSKPIIVTSDYCILDGHHRWKACCLSGDQQDVIQIDMLFDELYEFVKDKEYVSYKGINEANYNSNSSMADFSSSEQYDYDDKSDFEKYHLEKQKEKLNEDGDGGGSAVAGATGGDASTPIAQNDKSNPESFASGTDPDKKKNLPNSTTNVESPDNLLFKTQLRRKKVD